jgi:hypothetical protein
MCLWERVTHRCCGYSKRVKMQYSCDLYRRHVYGPCHYDARYDRNRVVSVSTDEDCPECRELYQYVNYH